MAKFDDRINAAIQKADEAFWKEIVEAFPEVKSGDFPPESQFHWSRSMEQALGSWLMWNHPNERRRDKGRTMLRGVKE